MSAWWLLAVPVIAFLALSAIHGVCELSLRLKGWWVTPAYLTLSLMLFFGGCLACIAIVASVGGSL